MACATFSTGNRDDGTEIEGASPLLKLDPSASKHTGCSGSSTRRSSGKADTDRLLLPLDGETAETSEGTGKNFGLSGLMATD